MKAYEKELLNLIEKKLTDENNASFIRVDYFNNPEIYLNIAILLTKKYRNVQVKLAEERLKLWQENIDLSATLGEFVQKGFVAKGERLTKLRNNFGEEKNTYVLLGTESVQDKGGLADFYEITPSDLEIELKENYSKWFSSIDLSSDRSKKIVNNLFTAIFNLVPKDLMKVSELADRVADEQIVDIEELVELVFNNLWSIFRIPNIYTVSSKLINELQRSSNLKILNTASVFIKREEYKSGITSTKEKQLLNKFERFKEGVNYSEVESEIISKFGSYDNLKNDIVDFSKGSHVNQLREKLGQFDFYIISQIIGLKNDGVERKKDKLIKVTGTPIQAFSTMIFDFVLNNQPSYFQTSDEVIIEINSIKLADAVLEEDQTKRWQELCISLGGLVEYLNDGLPSFEIKYSEEDVFTRGEFDTAFVSFEGPNKLSKIDFTISKDDEKAKYQWTFSPYDYWLQSFNLFPLFKSSLIENSGNVLPIFTTEQLGNLLTSTDTESFHYQLKSYEISMVNVMDEISKLRTRESIIFTRLFSLCDPFSNVLEEICNNGLYYAINARRSTHIAVFVNKYAEAITTIYQSFHDFTKVEKDYLYLVSNLFSIISSKEELSSLTKVEGAIIPPYHPSMLEKIEAQQLYLRQGLSEVIEDIIAGRMQNLKSCTRRFESLAKQSIIISGVDTIISDDSLGRTPSQVLGYYALHGKTSTNAIMDSSSLLDIDLLKETESVNQINVTSSKESIIQEHIQEYLRIFPANIDFLSLCFINFEYLHPIIEGIKNYINNVKTNSRSANIELYILSEKVDYKAQHYMKMWLESNFTEDDNFNIQIYFNKFADQDSTEKKVFDLVFIENLLETTEIKYSLIDGKRIKPNETKFPMVFHPMPTSRDSDVRHISVSQMQFEASFAHSQLAFWIENEISEKNRVYSVEKVLKLRKNIKEVLSYYHNHARWIVSIDTGLDKAVYEEGNIISFSTGEGAYGELNVAISASNSMKEDISQRLKKRLKKLFPHWDEQLYEEAAIYCLQQTNVLDGIKILKALNPNDYEIHSFLASILAVKSINIKEFSNDTILKSFISLDSYNHWFADQPNRPDFLELEITHPGIEGEKLVIKANLIECKMGKENIIHIEKGLTQLSNGLKFLQDCFNPNSTKYDRRYWYAQLYRLLAFSPVYITESEKVKEQLNYNLLKILNGEFIIEWDTTLLTYWLDLNKEEISENVISLMDNIGQTTHKAFGQLYIQKNLLHDSSDKEFVFESPNTEEMDNFADDEQSFKEVLKYRDEENPFVLDNPFEEEMDTSSLQVEKVVNFKQKDGKQKDGKQKDIIDKTISNSNKENTQNPSDIKEVDNNISMVADPEGESYGGESPVEAFKSLENIRILLGEEQRTGKKIYWEYGHSKLENRHILISGKSGVGKTYFMQCLLLELARNNISSLIFDYTDGFKKSKLEEEFKDELGDNIVQFHVQKNGFPVNPFKKNLKELDEDEYDLENDVDVAERIKSVFSAVYKGMGDQQANAIYRATLQGLRKYNDAMNLEYLRTELEQIDNASAKTVLSKIEPLLDRKPFDTETVYDWESHREKDGIVFVVQLSGFVREVQLIITEFILWDLWNFNLSHGSVAKPFPVILDEAQNLDHSESSPSAKVLTEGRKFGWSGWYATQFMQGQMEKDEIRRLQNASQKIYFSPPESEVPSMAGFLSSDSNERKEWAVKLSKLGKGQCIVSGPMMKDDGQLQYVKPMTINVTPLGERKE